MKPLQLPWMYVSPSGSRGLDYHLSPDLFIRMEGIIAGNMEFVVSHVVLGLEGIEVDAIQAEHIFKSEFLPAKSKERVIKAFKDEQSSCFFQTRHMEWLQKHFDENNFISTDVTVYYKDKKIEDVASLPAKEFKLAYHALDDLGAVQIMPLKENREELTQKYEERYQEKVAELEEKTKKSLWEKVKAPNATRYPSARSAKAGGIPT
jgi:hypothetical protein